MPKSTINITRITFPEISLNVRDAHKLRGYFGNLFAEHAPILSNHFDDGKLRYKYPEVQYKVIERVPTLIGIGEGGNLMIELFMKINQLVINGQTFEVYNKNIARQTYTIGIDEDLHRYRFETLWMALNQDNYPKYINAESENEQKALLKNNLISHILAFYKGIGLFLEPHERIMAQIKVSERETQFKSKSMLAFAGEFTTNALLPDGIGIGKSPSRGFGTIKKIDS
ncbi:CRISPR-associated endonuclease Cas6 [Emticicia sp. 17c]|uniref:CRISPR-associated endonuclease Cas6 n=1 Tax=Emticicia sp. 17c TaxID=3127704 RepID=UPI00301C71AC